MARGGKLGGKAAALGVLVIALLACIPLLGALIRFFALIPGMGALPLQLRRGERPASFGQITSVRGMRTMRLTMRLRF